MTTTAIQYTNKELHGAAALDDSSSEWESEIGE